ncbi:hypothetical protein VTK56DRAFT_5634 [Thermocarpiscus australiensis]
MPTIFSRSTCVRCSDCGCDAHTWSQIPISWPAGGSAARVAGFEPCHGPCYSYALWSSPRLMNCCPQPSFNHRPGVGNMVGATWRSLAGFTEGFTVLELVRFRTVERHYTGVYARTETLFQQKPLDRTTGVWSNHPHSYRRCCRGICISEYSNKAT